MITKVIKIKKVGDPFIKSPILEQARSSKDTSALVIGLIASGAMLSIYLFFAILIASLQDGIQGFIGEVVFVGLFAILLAVVLGTIMITIRMQRQIMLANALNIRFSSMSWLHNYAISVCSDLNIPPMEIFIIQQPMLNAYAFGFMKPYCVVLHSGAVDGLTPDELKSIVVHEIGHIAYKHTSIGIYLAPLYSIPFFGGIFTWIFGFWSRRAEKTADRLSVAYTADPDVVISALIKVHVGPNVTKYATIEGITNQLTESNNGFNLVSETFSTHPYLVRRAQAIYEFASTHSIPAKQSGAVDK